MSVWSFLGDIAETALHFVPGGSTVAKLIPGVSSIFSDADAEAKSKEQLANQKSLMQYQNELNLQNWQTQQDFNNYANDLQHMKEAGINPLAFAGASPTSAVSGVSGGTAPDLMSLLNYQRDMKLAQSQLQLQRLDAEAKRYENKALKAEADARVAEAKNRKAEADADLRFGDRLIGEQPDNLHDWLQDESGYWYYIGEDGKRVYPDTPTNVTPLRDILRNVRYNKELDEAETVRYNKYMADYNQRIRTIEYAIENTYGITMASETLHKLLSDIANIEARTDLTNAQKFQLEMDNEIWSKIGTDGRMIVKVLQYILGFVR